MNPELPQPSYGILTGPQQWATKVFDSPHYNRYTVLINEGFNKIFVMIDRRVEPIRISIREEAGESR